MRLLERDVPIGALRTWLDESATDGGRLVFVEGEAGIGKTSLLGAFRGAVPEGTRVLLGSCDPLSTPRPLGPIVDVADRLDPAFARLLAATPPAPRAEVLAALLAALRESRDPVVLMLDDLHWADEATLDAVRFVGRRVESTRALVVGTYRDDEVGARHPLRVVVGDLATSPAVRRLPLGALSVGSVGELARGTDLDPAALHRQTGGNPFYVTEVIAGAPARIPSTVRDAVLARAARLSAPARRTLDAAAVIGPAVEPWLLAAVLDDEPFAGECLERGVLRTDGTRYFFRHEVARETILQALDPGARTAVHARVLAALEAAPAEERPLARLAHHAEGAGDRDAVLRYAPAAGAEAADAGSHREAAAQYARAVRFAGALPPAERAALLEDHAREQGAIERIDVANNAWAEAIATWAALGDVRRQSLALAAHARSLIVAGRDPEAEIASRRAIEVLADVPSGPEKVEALGVQAYLRMLSRDNEQAVELARRTIDVGRDEPAAISSVMLAWNTLGSARILLGDHEGGRADLETSLRLASEHGIDRHMAGAWSNLVSALGEMYRFADTDAYFHAAHRFVIERDLDTSRAYLEAWRALSLLYRGRWRDAEELALGLIAADRSSISRTMALFCLGRLRTRRGDPDNWETLDAALAGAEPTGTLQRIGPVRAARAEAAWLAGDPARSATEARAAVPLALHHRHPWHIGELGWWLAKAGAALPDTSAAAEPWRLQLDGRWREAADAWTALDCPYEAARALLESDEIGAVEDAHAAFDALGARPATGLAARRLRELGARSIPRGARPTTRANPAGLTARELEVLRLLVGGLRNQDIAERLVLSTRTVDHHVSAVLGKLGVERRRDAAAAASRLGIELQTGQSTPPN